MLSGDRAKPCSVSNCVILLAGCKDKWQMNRALPKVTCRCWVLIGKHLLNRRKAEYQVLYVEDELMSAAEQEDSKVIRADERF